MILFMACTVAQGSVSFMAHQLDRVKRLLVQQEKLNTHLAQMVS